MHSSAALSGSNVTRPQWTPSTMGYIGAFGLVGAIFVALQPGVAFSLAIVALVSLSVAALSVSAVAHGGNLDARRATIRNLSSVLLAGMLWLAILGGVGFAGGQGALAALLALAFFAALVVIEAALSAAITSLLSSVTGSDPAIGIAVQVADKYAGFAGELN